MVAVIGGGGDRKLSPNVEYTFDGSLSKGDFKSLEFTWKCTQIGPLYNPSCPLLFSPTIQPFITTVKTTGAIADNLQLQLSLTVTDKISGDASVAKVMLYVSQVYIPSVTINATSSRSRYNIGDKVSFEGYMRWASSYPANGYSAVWSIDEFGSKLLEQPLSPLTTSIEGTSVDSFSSFTFNFIARLDPTFTRDAYTFRLSIVPPNNFNTATMISWGAITIFMNTPPTPGQIIVAPTQGTELSTQFTLRAKNWDDIDLPLSFQFYYVSFTGLRVSISGSSQDASSVITKFPAGRVEDEHNITCILQVSDSAGGSSILTSQAVVAPMVVSFEQMTTLMDDGAGTTRSVDSLMNAVMLVSSVMNRKDCTSAPKCTLINREECSRTGLY